MKTDFDGDGEDYYADANSPQNDLSEDENELMKEWIRYMIELYNKAKNDSEIKYANGSNGFSEEDFVEIINGLMQVCTELCKENKKQIKNSR